ncbi:uncharacterized protein PAN0_001d0282 [Moesziomyces antarcticus]|uniref:Pali-domain-containing protein n=1 Tax=Pseudozyma antarctica TaxID=84753 RepID=A0A5C3FG02_PSEA2|nr:uncharacterized protein PAN0_001d0282 [Moesziomyces antarcticus]GAK62085.1 conserved hypothetical protein [Moesziomyces antarcticus]SPO42615.1 uncharacterized protein PSANT_00298 [Moesziomyces antarcticus]
MIRPATPGTLLTLVAAILLGLVTISTPIIKSIYFLEATIGGRGSQNGQVARFGTLGYCIGDTCSNSMLGYSFDPNQLLGIEVISGRYTTAVIKGLTYTLILHPIALAFAAVSVLLGLISHCRELSTNCFGTFVTGIGAFITLVAFGLDLALFIIAKKRINSINGASAELGMAIWMTLAAWILMFLAGCAFSCGICSRRKRNRVKDSHLPPDTYGARPAAPMQDRYAEQMRMDALDAEADRKRRQATLDRNRRDDLPKFAEYETEHEVPLKNDYDDGAYHNGASQHQPGLAYSTNSNIARAGAAGAGLAASGSVINGVGQGYGRRQAQASRTEDFSSSPPMLNNSAGYGAHNLQAQRQASITSPTHTEPTYVPGVGPQPYRDGLDSQGHGSSLTPAPRSYSQIASPPPTNDYAQQSQYPSQHQQQPQYDSYGNMVPSAMPVPGGSQFSQSGARRQPTGEYGHPTEYSGATFGPSSGFHDSGSRMRGPRDLPSIPQHETAEPQEIVYDNTGSAADRRQGTVDDGFGLASNAHGSHQQHEQAGYDNYASSAYDHQSQSQQYHSYHPSSAGANDGAAREGTSAAQYGDGSQYHDYQSSVGPPGYESVAGGSAAYQHNHYPREKS